MGLAKKNSSGHYGLFKDRTNLDAKDSLPQENVTAGRVNVVVHWVSGVDHETVDELHGLGPLSPQLARDNNLASIQSCLLNIFIRKVSINLYSDSDRLKWKVCKKVNYYIALLLFIRLPLGSRLHDESEDTVAGPPHGQTTDQLVPEGLSLGEKLLSTPKNNSSIASLYDER